jgi:hypothetical protein
MVERGVSGLDNEAILWSRSYQLDKLASFAAARPLDDAVPIAIKNAEGIIGVDDRRGPLPGCLDQVSKMRKAVAKTREQPISVFVAEIVEHINQQDTVAHETRVPHDRTTLTNSLALQVGTT